MVETAQTQNALPDLNSTRVHSGRASVAEGLMRKRRIGVVAGLGLAVVLVSPHLLLPPYYPTEVRCARVKPGMTLEEAFAILELESAEWGGMMGGGVHTYYCYWQFPDGSVSLASDPSTARVRSCIFSPRTPSPLWDHFRRWLPW
jgi:hypothetical protein